MPDIYFATNREVLKETSRSAKLGKRFNVEGPQFFRVGRAQLELKGKDPKKDDRWRFKSARLYKEDMDPDDGVVQRGSQDLFEDLRKLLRDHCQDVLIYLHGYANDFDDSMIRAAALQEIYHQGKGDDEIRDPLVFAFGWPSNGNVLPRSEYFSDRHDAQMSGIAMARSLLALIDFMLKLREQDRDTIRKARNQGEVPADDSLDQCQRRIHLMAHSMGNFALRHAVLAFANELARRPLPRLFDNVFLMAADEDADAFASEQKLGLLTELANAIHVYHSEDDRALKISDLTKGNPERLGADGPKDLDQLSPRIFAVDCKKVDDTIIEHGRHQYYRLRDEVIDDVKELLKGTPPDQIAARQVIRPGRSWRLPDKS